jgi:hypothetical protein
MKLIFTILASLLISCAIAQKSDYFVVGTDTTFCTKLSASFTSQSYIGELNYLDSESKKVALKGRKNIPDIILLCINGKTLDRVPQKLNKPEGYIKWSPRVVNGKLIVNYYESTMSTQTATTSIVRFYLRMPDGTYYNIYKSKDVKTFIIPYLEQCKSFKSKYKGDYSRNYDDFTKTIELYNSLCGED